MGHAHNEPQSVDQMLKEIKELREGRDYYKGIIESADKGIWVINDDHKTIYINYMMAEMLGYTIDEVMGTSVLRFMDEDSWQLFMDRLSRCTAGCRERFDFKFRRKDGEEVWTLAGLVPFFDRQGFRIGVTGTFADITERKQMETALREAKDNLLKAQHVGRMGSWVRDLKTDKFEFSGEISDILGIKQEPVSLDDVLKIYSPGEREKMLHISQAAIEKEGSYKTDVRMVRPDGKAVYCHLEAEVVRDKSGKAVKVVGILQDITERKLIEIALRESRAQTEFFMDLISHDIGNMNQAIMGYIELALERPALPEDGKEHLIKAIEITKDSSRLINDVRKLRGAISGEMPAKRMDAGKALSEAIADHSHEEGRDVRIKYEPKTGCYVMANELLKDAFSNIIMNSIKHSGGPLTINISLREAQEDGKGYCRADFEDNGPGVPDIVKEKLLIGVREATEKSYRSGLGLKFVKTLVDTFHGKVWMEDRVAGDYGKGVRVVVMLPAVV